MPDGPARRTQGRRLDAQQHDRRERIGRQGIRLGPADVATAVAVGVQQAPVRWQDEIRALMDMPGQAPVQLVVTGLVAVVVGYLLLVVARLVRALGRVIVGGLDHVVPRAVSTSPGVVITAVLVVGRPRPTSRRSPAARDSRRSASTSACGQRTPSPSVSTWRCRSWTAPVRGTGTWWRWPPRPGPAGSTSTLPCRWSTSRRLHRDRGDAVLLPAELDPVPRRPGGGSSRRPWAHHRRARPVVAAARVVATPAAAVR